MSANSQRQAPRLFGTVLCAAASLLLLFSPLYLYAAGGGGGPAVLLLLAGLGLLLASVWSFRRRQRSGLASARPSTACVTRNVSFR